MRSIIRENGLEEVVIKLFSKYGRIKNIVNELHEMGYDEITESNVNTFIDDIQEKTETPAVFITEHDASLVEKNMRYRMNLQKKTVEALKQTEDHVAEIESHFKSGNNVIKTKCECGREVEIQVPSMNQTQYHKAKDSAIKTKNDLIKHLRSTQIKFIELAKNQILRESMMSIIREVDPDVADKIFQKLEQKQKELGII